MDTDPFELHNLADDPDRVDTMTELRALLESWISETGDQGAVPENPEGVANEVASMEGVYREYMEEKGLLPDASRDALIDWWRSFYRDRYVI